MAVTARDPVADLRRIAFLLERALESTYKIKAFRGAGSALLGRSPDEVAELAAAGQLKTVKGVGDTTAKAIAESLAGEPPAYLVKLEAEARTPLATGGEALRAALRGDCHTHSDWSDGGSPPAEMAFTARELGHDYLVLTDHSPNLTVANGLSPARLRRQLEVVAQINERLAPFRVLTGIEVNINEDGTLDQEEDLLAELDVVVSSVHSKLRMGSAQMTERMLTAIENPHTDILGHCTGRMVRGRDGRNKDGRPESTFDAARGVQGLRGERRRGGDQQPPGAPGPAAAPAAAGGRGGLPVLRRLRRPRPRPARLAALRLLAGRGVRGRPGERRQHLGRRRPRHLEPRPLVPAGLITPASSAAAGHRGGAA